MTNVTYPAKTAPQMGERLKTKMESQHDELTETVPAKQLTGKAATLRRSQKRLRMLERVGERYGLDTRQTVELMLSEFTGTGSRTPNTSDHRRILLTSLNNLSSNGLDKLDEALIAAEVLDAYHGGRILHDVRELPGGWVQIQGRLALGD
jgi:hypothetical protein